MIARRLAAAGIIAVLAVPPYAFAQNSVLGGAAAVPLAPPVAAVPAQPYGLPQVQTPNTPPPPGMVQTPLPPADTGGTNGESGSAAPVERQNPAPGSNDANAAASQPAVMPAAPNTWLPRRNAVLGVLDKEDGAVSRLVVPVGNQVTRGKLQIKVLACVARPPSLPPDSAVFLSVRSLDQQGQDSPAQNQADQAEQPLFRGWLLHSEPGASVVDDATDTFRVIGCT